MKNIDNKIRIGLLEDDVFFADIIKTVLEKKEDWSVSVYHSVEALKKEIDMPDVFVFDYVLTKDDSSAINSAAALSWIVDKYANIPIIYYTNFKDMDTAIELLKSGACDFLLKDKNSIHELIESIKDALTMKRLKEKAIETELKVNKLFKRLISVTTAFALIALLLFIFGG